MSLEQDISRYRASLSDEQKKTFDTLSERQQIYCTLPASIRKNETVNINNFIDALYLADKINNSIAPNQKQNKKEEQSSKGMSFSYIILNVGLFLIFIAFGLFGFDMF